MPLQFFAVPAHAVVSSDEQREAWAWYSDTFETYRLGVFTVADSGLLEFEPNNGGG